MKNSLEHIFVEAGEKVELFSRRFSSVPMTYEFTAAAADDTELDGKVEIHSKQSLGKVSVKTSQLQALNTIKASMWDTFVTVYVVAKKDLQVTTPQRKIGLLRITVALLMLLLAVASALIIGQL